ncbi:MAG: hypothetical protein SXA11_12780 [Cyanobacteriota bacterium]|nr:hypothetical protein [Cyanobacteriota bacterium]
MGLLVRGAIAPTEFWKKLVVWEHLIEAKMQYSVFPITYYPLPKSVKFLAFFKIEMHPVVSELRNSLTRSGKDF